MAFTGFPDAAFDFYERLAADNTRTFWQANKAVYSEAVRAPLDSLLDELAEYGPFHVFRPYKDHQGAYGESEGGSGHYVQVSARGLMVGTGYYAMATDQLARFRAAVDAPAQGAVIAGIIAGLVKKGYAAGAIGELKTAPRGYPKDHLRIELLRRKGLMVSRSWEHAAWMGTRAVVKRVRDSFTAADAMNAWLDTHVGPSTLAPDDDELARFGPF
jgi:hypothetical protein